MTFIHKQEAIKGRPGHVKNIVSAQIKIKNGASGREIRNASRTGSMVNFQLDVPEEESSFPLWFLKNTGLETNVSILAWWKKEGEKPSTCILCGKFGPLTDGFNPAVYHGKFNARFDTKKRQGVMTIKFSWESVLADTSC